MVGEVEREVGYAHVRSSQKGRRYICSVEENKKRRSTCEQERERAVPQDIGHTQRPLVTTASSSRWMDVGISSSCFGCVSGEFFLKKRERSAGKPRERERWFNQKKKGGRKAARRVPQRHTHEVCCVHARVPTIQNGASRRGQGRSSSFIISHEDIDHLCVCSRRKRHIPLRVERRARCPPPSK